MPLAGLQNVVLPGLVNNMLSSVVLSDVHHRKYSKINLFATYYLVRCFLISLVNKTDTVTPVNFPCNFHECCNLVLLSVWSVGQTYAQLVQV